MKTIEEATDDYMRNFDKKGQLFIEDIADAFRKGAEFAQQWISTEDELPPINMPVLAEYIFSSGQFDYQALRRIPTKENVKGWQWSSITFKTYFALAVTH